jgi:hypothetical protein
MNAARGAAPRQPFGNMRFRLEIDGLPGSGATEVLFPEARLLPGARKAGAAQYGPLIVKRGLTASRDWHEWWDAARRGWLFEGAAPVAYHLSPLNALGNEPVIETLELSVESFAAIGR